MFFDQALFLQRTRRVELLILNKLFRFFFCDDSIHFRTMASPDGASRSRSLDTPHSIGIFWTSEQPVTETSTRQHTTEQQNILPPAEFNPTTPASEWLQTQTYDRAATGIG